MLKPVTFLRLASAAVLSLPLLSQAVGLGRMSVQSFLGQPLRAEIEIVSVQPGEEASLEARLASGNAFAQAGIEFSPALTSVQFAIERREGRPTVLRVTSRQPVNEPFLDLLVELRWDAGLLVREYTILLDPPEYRGPKPVASAPAAPAGVAAAPAPALAAPVATPTPAPAPAAAPSSAAAEAMKPEARVEERPMAAAPAPASAQAKPEPTTEGRTYEVKKGDTLGAIARQYRPEGVSFNQMLIALQRANEDAFIRNNVNLVRAGRILNIPDNEALAAVETADANRLVIAQHADFAEYKSRLAVAVATAPSAPVAAERSAAGSITPKAEEPKPAAPKDQLKLSKADPKKPAASAARAAREDDLAARERALSEAQSRVGDLEKNVTDLQKLVEMRNRQLAELQQKAAAAPAPASAAKAPEPPKPAPAPQAAKAPEAKPAAPAPAKPVAGPPPVTATPKPAAAKPKPRPVQAPPPPEPSLVDEFLDNPIALGGLGGVILLLGGYGAWAWKRKKNAAGGKFQDSVLGAASVEPTGEAGGASVAPGGTPSVSPSSVSQASVAGMEADDVDPIAEADVYMAYGRDAQAEEILKEALQKDANRVPVHAKLLEIYANRRDAQSFEQGALKLKGITKGSGPDWDKAVKLGRSIDPGNGLYGGTGEAPVAAAPAVAAAPVVAAAAPTVDFDIGGGVGADSAPAQANGLDLDLGGAPAASQDQSDFSPSGTLIIDSTESKAASSGLDFDLGASSGVNFNMPAAAPAAAAPAPSAPAAGGGLDFDLNLGGSDAPAAEPSAPAMDLSEISLDLGTPGDTAAAGAGADDPKWQEVATKLDLAKAYEEMGDKDGARELLNEVVREGDAAQQAQANQMLAKLG